MVRVHPSFDMITATWFTDDGFEAPCLAELKGLLPPGTKIVGYYPNGYEATRPVTAESTVRTHRPPTSAFPPAPAGEVIRRERQVEKRARASRHSLPREEILNRWARGETAPDIAAALGITPCSSVGGFICSARKAGDPRAVARAAPRGPKRSAPA